MELRCEDWVHAWENQTSILGRHGALLYYYKEQKEHQSDTVFPELRGLNFKDNTNIQKKINYADKKFNKHLAKIAKAIDLEKPLTMHIARHTFGNISGENIPLQMLQKLYRHTVITTTMAYQSNFAFKDADEALDNVIQF